MLFRFRKKLKNKLVANGLEMKLPIGPFSLICHYSHRLNHIIPLPVTRLGILLDRDSEKMRHYRSRELIGPTEQRIIVCDQYFQHLHRHLHLDPPVSFTEKINWLKLYDENPLISVCCDKYRLKDYLKEKLGKDYSAKTFFVSDHFSLEDFEKLPQGFALKVNWSSGYNIIVKNKDILSNREKKLIVFKVREWLRPHSNSFYSSFYHGYKDMQALAFAEELLPSSFTRQEYKVFCFSGKPGFVLLEENPNSADHSRACLDCSGNLLPFTFGEEPVADNYVLPQNYKEILNVAQLLSTPFSFVRVDFLTDGERLLVGEMTFYSGGGFSKTSPPDWDERLGEYLVLN